MKELFCALFCVAVKHWSATLRPGDTKFTDLKKKVIRSLPDS